MAFNGSGVFVRLYNWVNDKNAAINITASRMDNEFNGIATGLSQCITKDGQSTLTADIPMSGYKFTNVGDATASNQYATYKQLQTGTISWLGTPGGTVDAMTASPSISLATYSAGQVFQFASIGTNTIAAPTLNISGLGAKSITYRGAALQAGDVPATGVVSVVYNGTTFDMINCPINRILEAKGTTIASATTTDIGAADSDFIDVSGTTTITGLGSTTTRNHVWVNFTGALTLTHNATSLILPGGLNIITAAGDVAEFIRITGSNWVCVGYTRASGGDGSVPIGTVLDYAGLTEPANYKFAYGQAISRTNYAILFSVIGTTYGVGDGSTTFNLPDYRGRVGAGVDDMGGSAANRITSAGSGITGTTLGATGGTETHQLTTAQLASHTHEQRGATSGTNGMRYETTNASATITNSGIQTGTAGSGQAHQNTQPSIIINKIIKVQ